MRLETSGPPIILFSTYWPSQDSISALHQRDNIASEVNQITNLQMYSHYPRGYERRL